MKSKKEEWMKAGIFSTLTAIAIVGILILTQTGDVMVEQTTIEPKRWHRIPLGEADGPATNVSGGSCVLNVSIVALGSNNYNANITYNTTDWYSRHYNDTGDITNNSHIGSDIPYETAFEIIVKVRWNRTHAYNNTAGSSPSWVNTYVRGNITCSFTSPAIAAETPMAEYNITVGSGFHGYDGFVWYYYVANNSGVGYQLARGVNATSCSFTFDAYY